MKLIILFFLFSIYIDIVFGMTRPQLKKTMTIMKNQCLQKLGIDESKVANIEQGDFREDPEVKCFVACVYKTAQVTKNDRLNKEMTTKQIDTLYPPDLKTSAKELLEQCISIQDNYADFCERIFYVIKCLYEKDPPNFIFP